MSQEEVEAVLAEIRPVVESVGCQVELTAFTNGEAVVALRRGAHVQHDGAFRVRTFLERELFAALPELSLRIDLPEPQAPAPRGEGIRVEVVPPPPTADTAVVKLDRPLGPEGTAMFTSPEEASDYPLLQRLLRVDGVAAILAKGEMLLVSRTEGPWEPLLASLTALIEEHFEASADSGEAATDTAQEEALWDKVWALLDEQVNPQVASHGGKISLVEVRGTELWLQMGGGCQGCGAAAITLKHGVEKTIREAFPEVTAIHDVTDHGAGANPYM